MSQQSQAVYFNAVPLFVLAATYLIVTAVFVTALLRAGSASTVDVTLATIFPAVAVAAAIYGAQVLHDRSPIGGSPWFPFAATLFAFLPAIVFFGRRGDGDSTLTAGARADEAEARASVRDRELEAVALISNALARTNDPLSAGRVLLDEVAELLNVEFTALALVDDESREATGLVARSEGADLDWWRDVRLDLEREPSGIASAVFEAAPITVYDTAGSAVVSRRLVELTGAKSGAWIPLVSEEHVIGVLVAAATSARRAFTNDELTLMQALASEAALAIARTRSASALESALDRERLVAGISRSVRSELDVDAVLATAVEEVGRALSVARCFIRLDDAGELPTVAQWQLEGLVPIDPQASQLLPVSNLAARERRTVAVADIEDEPRLDDPELGERRVLRELGSRAVLATPIIVFDQRIGVVGVHRTHAGGWSEEETALVEAVAREVGLAVHTAGLLEENERRLEQQAALFNAAQVVTSELRLETVMQLLVDEVAALIDVEAADCFLFDADRRMLRCAAVHGFDESLINFEFSSTKGLAGVALSEGRPVLSDDYSRIVDAVPHPAYAGFRSAIVAPMVWSGETRGVLGVGTRQEGRSFDRPDVELLGAFASLASLALRNAESFEERLRQARIQRGFYGIASVLGETLSLAETLDAVAKAACEALGGAFAAVVMPSGEHLEVVAAHNLPQAVGEFLPPGLDGSRGPLLGAAQNRRLLASSELADDDRFDPEWREVAIRAGFPSLLAIPVERPRSGGNGLVIVFFDTQRRVTTDDLELAGHVARAARGALERADLYEAERTSRALSQQLARTGTLLATELDPAAVLDEVVEQAPALLGAEACTIRLLDGDELVVSAATGEDAESALGSRSASTAWLVGDVVQSRSPVAVVDASGDERLLEADPILAAGYAAYLGVPLASAEGGSHGVLAVYSRRPRQWRDEEIEALVALGSNASAALSNAELYQRVALEKERSVAILANIADGIVAVDRDGNVVLWNAAAERITGVPAGEALGRAPEQVLQRRLESEGEAQLGDRLVSIRRGGEEVWLSLTEAIMRDPAGAVAGRIFAFRDISAERVVEQMKSEFVSTVSHELRTPLTSIYGFAETLLRRDVLFGEEERQTFLGYIASESERLTGIVDALLEVARLDTGDLQVHLAPTDVRSVVSEVVTSVERAAAVNGHHFVVDLPAEPLDAEADSEKLRQILSNLLDNAVKFSPDGGTVTVAARRKDATVEVSVADEGIGIPVTEQQRIFTRFYRRQKGGVPAEAVGTGLGLFIARGLVEAMGGRIWVTSTQGEGSSFVFELPLAAEPVATETSGMGIRGQ